MRERSAAAHAPTSRPARPWAWLVALALLLLPGRPALAAPIGGHFELTQVGGYTRFEQARNSLTGQPIEKGLYLGARFGYHLERWLGLEGAAGFTPTQEDIAGGRDLDFWHVSGNLVIRPLRATWGSPYVSVGGGGGLFKYSSSAVRDNQLNAEAAAGLQVWLNDAIGLRLEARDIALLTRGDLTNVRSNDYVASAGLTFALGARPRDTDGDGVPDRNDQCVGTPAGAKADLKGCPLDSDGDGVFDGLDQCDGPRGARVDAKGCPIDSDGDGVFDGLDSCATTPKGARVDAKGCPIDTDADGVFDGLDSCATTPKGCTVDAQGCPVDSDHDGVCDGLDQCPDTPANLRVDDKGCPIEISERETELLDTGMIRLDNVQFETGKAELTAASKASLDIVGRVLVKWPELRIEIGGHTDSRGSAKLNQRLSEARVDSVLAYLLRTFPDLKDEQYTAKGYGFSRPLVPNVSPEAMARNRRVEFVVLNKDVLRRESERRRLLEKSEPGK